MHVQVHVDVPAAADPLACGRIAGRVVAPGRDSRIDLLHLIGRRRPIPRRARGRRAQALRQPVVGREPLELAGQGDRIAGREQQPGLALPGELLVERQMRCDRDRARAEPRPDQPGATRGPPEATQTTSAAAISSSGVADLGPSTWTRSRRRSRHPHVAAVGQPDRRLPVERIPEPAQRAQEQAQRAALLLEAKRDPERPRRSAARARPAIPRSRARPARPARSSRGSSAASARSV